MGTALLERALADMDGLTYELIELWTFRDNERAQRLYRSAAVAADGATRPFEPLGIATVRMRRGLRPSQ